MRIVMQDDLSSGRWKDRPPRRDGDQTQIIKMKPGEPDYLVCYKMAPPSVRVAEMVMADSGHYYYRDVVNVEQQDALAYLDLILQGEGALVARIRATANQE